jgi:hypothetical protein
LTSAYAAREPLSCHSFRPSPRNRAGLDMDFLQRSTPIHDDSDSSRPTSTTPLHKTPLIKGSKVVQSRRERERNRSTDSGSRHSGHRRHSKCRRSSSHGSPRRHSSGHHNRSRLTTVVPESRKSSPKQNFDRGDQCSGEGPDDVKDDLTLAKLFTSGPRCVAPKTLSPPTSHCGSR